MLQSRSPTKSVELTTAIVPAGTSFPAFGRNSTFSFANTVEPLFLKAVEIVDDVAGAWDRDSIRTEPVSKALFQKFGQYYSG